MPIDLLHHVIPEIAIGKWGTSMDISYLDDFSCPDGLSLLNGFLASGWISCAGWVLASK